jgi:hypothetical protein
VFFEMSVYAPQTAVRSLYTRIPNRIALRTRDRLLKTGIRTRASSLPDPPDDPPSSSSSSSSSSSTGAFLATVAVGAFAGAAVVKYGSLLNSVAFTPDPVLALAMVFTPPAGFAVWMLSQSNNDE